MSQKLSSTDIFNPKLVSIDHEALTKLIANNISQCIKYDDTEFKDFNSSSLFIKLADIGNKLNNAYSDRNQDTFWNLFETKMKLYDELHKRYDMKKIEENIEEIVRLIKTDDKRKKKLDDGEEKLDDGEEKLNNDNYVGTSNKMSYNFL